MVLILNKECDKIINILNRLQSPLGSCLLIFLFPSILDVAIKELAVLGYLRILNRVIGAFKKYEIMTQKLSTLNI